MECHCSEILHNIRSWQFPYASINKYVTCQAQLTHITLLYNLYEKLQLIPPTSHNNDVCLPLCEPALCMLTNMHAYCYILDLSFILTPPKPSVVILPLFLWKMLTTTLATLLLRTSFMVVSLSPIIYYNHECEHLLFFSCNTQQFSLLLCAMGWRPPKSSHKITSQQACQDSRKQWGLVSYCQVTADPKSLYMEIWSQQYCVCIAPPC